MKKIIVLAMILWAYPSNADDFVSTRPMAMGGAYRAVATSNDAIFINPAGMSLFKRYSFELNYLFTPKYGAQEGLEHHVINVSIVDNQIQSFATGLSYTRIQGENKKGNRYDLAFSVELSDSILIGTDVKYINFERDGKEDAVDAVSVDLGMLIRLSDGFSIGLVGYNLTNTADYLEHPISMATAVMWAPFRTLELAFDWYINFQKPKDPLDPIGDKTTGFSYHFGIEYLMMGQLIIRAGYSLDQSSPWGEDQMFGLGLGYITDRFAFDFTYGGSFKHTWGGTFGFGVRLFM